MLQNFSNIQFLVGNCDTINYMVKVQPLVPFDDKVINFINALSRKVMISGKDYPDVVTFGFWCRKASLFQEKNQYDDLDYRLGKGIVFHIAPSNVPVNFAFSFVSGLLAGNANIIRVPSKDFIQISIICDAINELILGEYSEMAPYVCMIRYPHTKEITDVLSLICDTRVVWGGDNTIKEIRESQLNPRGTEITFADRFSIAIIDSDSYIDYNNKEQLAMGFYNDTYLSDQNACTSPRLIVWIGNSIKKAKEEFWNNELKIVNEKYQLKPVQAVGKLVALYKVAANCEINNCEIKENNIYRINLKNITAEIMNYKYNSGFFFEYSVKSLSEITPICTNRCQTISYFGIEKEDIRNFIKHNNIKGVDRFVKIGNTMNFSLIWDGYDLIRYMSRKINVE